MNAMWPRIEKEIRALLWLWCGLVFTAALVFFVERLELAFGFEVGPRMFSMAGLWLGLPLLATLSIGHEFQHRTAPLLLSQPVDRINIWREKWMVLAPAMATAAFLYIWRDVGLGSPHEFSIRSDWQTRAIAIVWIVTATCTAPFWTLVGRSIMNGFVLNLIQGFVMFWIWVAVDSTTARFVSVFYPPVSVFNPSPNFQGTVLSACLIAATGYAFFTLWLGRRKFVRFEVSGGSASADLLVPGSRTTSRSGGVLRSRPSQPILNLIRKELRLLWLVWVLVIAAVLGVLCLGALQFLPGYTMTKVGFLVSAFALSLALLSATLAGSLSMGEERASGTQSWHRTLPVPGTKLWLVKLAVVLSASFLALAVPITAAKFVVGENLAVPLDLGFRNHPVLSLLVFSSLIGFAAFWCACAVKGTVRAALLTIPTVGLVFVALRLSVGFVQGLEYSNFFDSFILRFHPFPFAVAAQDLARKAEWLLVLPLLVAVIQSYRLFRRELEDRLLPVLRPLLELALTVFLFGIAGLSSVFAAYSADRQLDVVLRETSDVIATVNLNITRPEASNPLQLTLEDMLKVYPQLSNTSRAWLRYASVVVSRNPGSRFGYSTEVRFRNGLICISGTPARTGPEGPIFVNCERKAGK
jgi:hypothetical protein